MNFDRVCTLVRGFYKPETLGSAEVKNPDQFRHQIPVIARGWEALVERDQTGVVLADEVGLGKTFEALGLAYFYLVHKLADSPRQSPRILVVLPPNLLTKWESELERFAKQVDTFRSNLDPCEQDASNRVYRCLSIGEEFSLRGSPRKLMAGDRAFKQANGLYLIREDTFDKLSGERGGSSPRAREKFMAIPWDVVIVDEAHRYARGSDGEGNQRSRAAKAFCTAQAQLGARILLCTATPFQLDTMELVSLLRLIEPREKYLSDVKRAIEQYNDTILGLQSFVESQSGSEKSEEWDVKAKGAKKRLEHLLRPYVLRSRRPENGGHEARQYVSKSIPPGDSFPWLYWDVREWARSLAQTGEGMQSFLPMTLQMTLSSPAAAAQHLEDWKEKHGKKKNKPSQICRTLLHKLHGDVSHPKFQALRDFMSARIEQAVLQFSGEIEELAKYKCVIFVTHPASINALVGNPRHKSDLAALLDTRVRERTEQFLIERNIPAGAFRNKLKVSVAASARNILSEIDFDEPGKPRIWETPYAAQTETSGNDFWQTQLVLWGAREDLSEVIAKERGLPSLGDKLTDNLIRKLTEPLNEYDLALKTTKDLVSAESDWQDAVQMQARAALRDRIISPLNDFKKWYFGRDNKADQPRERLRFRLSRLAYAIGPQRVIEELYQNVDFAKRQQIIDAFNNDLYPLILLCSSVAQEGIDLQRHCNTVIHYDLEWNPAKVEQREGRVDRLGKEMAGPVRVITYSLADTYDERILTRCRNRKIWMELYLCATWKKEGEKSEEETLEHKNQDSKDYAVPAWVENYRLDLRPTPV